MIRISALEVSCRESAPFLGQALGLLSDHLYISCFRVTFRSIGFRFARLSSAGLRVIPLLTLGLPTTIDLGAGLNPVYPVTHKRDSGLKLPSVRRVLGIHDSP